MGTHCHSVTRKPGAQWTQTLANARSIFLGVGGTDPRPGYKEQGTSPGRVQTQPIALGVSPRFQTPGRWPSLTLTLAFFHRTESEVPPRPASPKVSRSPSETATPVEDMARKSKLGGVGWGEEGGQGEGAWAIRPCPVFRQRGRPGLQVARSLGLLPDALGSDSSAMTLGR